MRATLRALSPVLFLSGCLPMSADFTPERQSIEVRTGLTLRRQSSMQLGPATLALARAWGGSPTGTTVRHVERVEMATFDVEGGNPRQAVDAFEAGREWTSLVRMRKGPLATRVFLEVGRETLSPTRRMLVVTAEDGQLVLVRLEAALEELLAQALSAEPS